MNENSRQYSNDDITVFWKPARCIHATTCFRELLEVFNPRNRPWVDMDGAPTERIIEVVDKCPTAALSWAYNKDLPETIVRRPAKASGEELNPETIYHTDAGKAHASVSVKKDGPLLVEGDFTIIDENGNDLPQRIITSFCRCGHSRSNPFCDGSHKKAGFKG